MLLDRLATPALMAALEDGPYSFLPALVKVQSRPGMLDLRFRSNAKAGTGEATLYAGERAAVRLSDDGSGVLTLTGPAKAVTRVSPEGRVQAALCSRVDYAVLDRESAFRFASAATKAKILLAAQTPFLAVAAAHIAGTTALPTQPVFGQEVDAIAVAEDGALEVIEVKCGEVTGRVGWTPAQVSFYASLFGQWLAKVPTATAVLQQMLQQRIELGLSPPVALRVPVEIRPVIALGAPIKNEAVARQRAEALQTDLLAAGIGWENLTARLVAADGAFSDLDWF